jgi:hypothetical protein
MDFEKRKQIEATRRRITPRLFETMNEIAQGTVILHDALLDIYPTGNLRFLHITQHLRRTE